MPSAQVERVHNIRSTEITPTATILQRLRSDDPAVVVSGLEVIPKDLRGADRDAVLQSLYDIANHKDTSVRAAFARVMGFLTWPELTLTVLSVLHDRKWVVRANCATRH